jgi:hypothetical protein
MLCNKTQVVPHPLISRNKKHRSALTPLPYSVHSTLQNPPPEDFQPSDDFKTCEDTLSWPFKPECFRLGSDYSTPHHSVDLRIKTCVPPREAALQEHETYLEPQDVLCNDEMWRTSDDDDDMPSSEDEVRLVLAASKFAPADLVPCASLCNESVVTHS